MNIKDYGGLAEVAALLGVSRQSASNYYSRRQSTQFPQPVHRLASTPLWYLPDVKRWFDWYRSDEKGLVWK